jgi:hypothetical protein
MGKEWRAEETQESREENSCQGLGQDDPEGL